MGSESHIALYLNRKKVLFMKMLLQESFLNIHIDFENHWLIADWKGYQKADSIKQGCEKILEFLKEYNVKKVLYNNLSTAGIWSGASSWVGNNWYPRLVEAGLTHCAWVYSSSMLSRLSTNEFLKYTGDNNLIKTFSEKKKAVEWLKTVRN